MPATVLRFAVGLFALFGLAVFSLGFPMLFADRCQTTAITAVGLAAPAAPADTEQIITPTTLNHTQQQGRHVSGLANTGSM